ncbi:MAG: hypothetical protein E6H75_12375 [Betaproteobacteria bacterium]|nr:MAG: hypothetical protein E6H75_12375 [Betaproteobacteria bacterium]
MSEGYIMLGFVVIMILYAVIGLMAAAGAIFIARKIFGPKAEQFFYGMFLILVAAFYLAFVAYFGNAAAWHVETAAVLVFAMISVFGVRIPIALIAGYSLHGLWDLLHELQAYGAYSAFEPGQLTAVPLAYGVFCAAFDVCIAAYCYARRAEWSAAWTVQPEAMPPA